MKKLFTTLLLFMAIMISANVQAATRIELWSGSTQTGNWAQYVDLTSEASKAILANAQVGDYIVVTLTPYTNAENSNACVVVTNPANGWAENFSDQKDLCC